MGSFNQAFENAPDVGDDAGTGPTSVESQLETIKSEVRGRASVEHDFAAGDQAAPSGATPGSPWNEQDGRHRPGSAVAFYQSATPTQLQEFPYDQASGGAAASRTLGTKDAGRIWVDSDDGRLWVWDGTAFKVVATQAPVFDTDVVTGAFTASHFPANAWTDAGVTVTVAVPNDLPSGWGIRVRGHITVHNSVSSAEIIAFARVMQNINAAGATEVAGTTLISPAFSGIQNFGTIHFDHVVEAPTKGDSYVYTVELFSNQRILHRGLDVATIDSQITGNPSIVFDDWVRLTAKIERVNA